MRMHLKVRQQILKYDSKFKNVLREERVIDFYNKGGGAGLGFDLPHQTLPFDNLELNEDEQAALVAYLKTLTDTKVTGHKKDLSI